MDIELIRKLYKARQEYKKLEKEIYDSIKKSEVGYEYKISNDVRAIIGIARSWNYPVNIRKEMDKVFKKFRKGIKPRRTIFIKFYE